MRFTRLLLFAFCLVPLTACNTIQVHLGTKIYLAKTPVTSMAVSLPTNPGIAPGEKSPLVATFVQSNGKALATEGKGKGKVLWADIVVTPSVVTVNKKGVITLARDPRLSDGKTGHVSLTVPSHPDLKAELDIPLRYDYPFVADYDGGSGASGGNGLSGTDGTAGFPGTPASIDPDHPSPGTPGGNGGNGTDGGNGSDGGNGGSAPPVTVLVTLRPGPRPLLQFGITAPGHKQRFYLVDPQGGTLSISALGGSGGSGGKGGSGGRGGSGGSGSPDGTRGSDGQNGRDGSDGSAGSNGSISVTYDPSAQPYLAVVKTSPRAILQQALVPPIW